MQSLFRNTRNCFRMLSGSHCYNAVYSRSGLRCGHASRISSGAQTAITIGATGENLHSCITLLPPTDILHLHDTQLISPFRQEGSKSSTEVPVEKICAGTTSGWFSIQAKSPTLLESYSLCIFVAVTERDSLMKPGAQHIQDSVRSLIAQFHRQQSH